MGLNKYQIIIEHTAICLFFIFHESMSCLPEVGSFPVGFILLLQLSLESLMDSSIGYLVEHFDFFYIYVHTAA